MQDIIDDPNRGFYCIDWNGEEELTLDGDGQVDSTYQRLDVALMPCNNIRTSAGLIPGEVNPECNPSLEAQQEYLESS